MADHATRGADVETITLHNNFQSSCSWRVRLGLELKGIPYKYKAVDLQVQEHHSEEYKKLNPLQLVPAVQIGGTVLADSMAILFYLEEKFPDKRPLMPKDLVQRAKIHQVVNLIASNIQPLQNTGVLAKIKEKLGPEEQLKWAQEYINQGFTALESILKTTAGKYSFGDELTLADVVLVPQLGNAERYKVDMTPYPTLKLLGTNLWQLPEVQKSLPANQPDACKC